MSRVVKTVLVLGIALLGCNRDPLKLRPAPVGEPAPGGGAQSGGDAAMAADGPRRNTALDSRGRDGGTAMDAGRTLLPDAAIVPSPGRDAGTILPGHPDAPLSRLTDSGVMPGSTDGPVTPRPADAAGPPIPSGDGGLPPPRPSDAAASGTDASASGPDSQPQPTTVLPGGACTDSGQCASLPGQTAVCVPPSIGFTSGYCAVPGCSILAQNCPGGTAAQCIPGDNGPICIGTCNPGEVASCRTGYVCQPLGLLLRAVCVPGCLDSSGCPTGTTCFPVAGSPVGQCRDSGSKVGDSCAVASECPQNGLCVSETDFGWPHGYCVTSKCATSADCATGTACTGNDPDGVCALRCAGDSDCRTGYHCAPAGRAGESVCAPHCTSDSQCEDLICHIGTGLC